MMPKGVEHEPARLEAARVHVRIPMMPKGVEHSYDNPNQNEREG